MKKKNETKNKTLKIKLEGDVSIQNVEKLTKQIMEPEGEFSGIEIHTGQAENFDLSFLQLLFMAEKKYSGEGKTFLVATEGSTLLPDIIYKAGLENQLNKIFLSEK